ncbi:MAG TPA: putative toxin-antitoxin system toxin component, PIN family, partial [Chloroflexota bacterium]|nr:putative toxin-antitoxin system toxin component, PIN family [Chloroflexota bacterium]
MIVVIDTNVLLKMAATGIRSPLFTSWQARQFDLYLSVEMLAELEEVLSRPKIQKFVPPTVGKQFLRLVVERAVFVPMAHTFPHSRDSGDDKVVATAVAAKADYLITVDKDLYDDATLVPSLA